MRVLTQLRFQKGIKFSDFAGSWVKVEVVGCFNDYFIQFFVI